MYTLYRLAMLILISALALTACQQSADTLPPTATDVPPISEEIEEPAPAAPETADEPTPTAEVALPDTPTPEPTEIPLPTPTEEAEPDPTDVAGEAPSEDVVESAEEIEEQETISEETSEPEAESTPAAPLEPEATEERTAPVVAPERPTTQPAIAMSALIIRDDETPAPPLVVSVSSNRAFPGYKHVLMGTVQNGGSENYAGLRLIGTFFRADGSRYGPISVNLQCPVLAPGDLCPFRIDATDKGLTEVMLHPEGYPTTRTTAEVTVSNVRTSLDSIGYVHIMGSVTNPNPVPVWDVTINGVLHDAAGAMVSLGTDVLVGNLEAGETATFDVPVHHQPYTGYQLFVTAEPR
jgi:hypothetical protein